MNEHVPDNPLSHSRGSKQDGRVKEHRNPDSDGEVVDTTPTYGQKLNSKLPTSTQRNKITPPQVVKSATYHQTARPPYTRPYPVSTTSPPPSSTSRDSWQSHSGISGFASSYDTREQEGDRLRYPTGSHNIPNARPEPEDDSQEYNVQTPRLRYQPADITSSTTESNEKTGHRPVYDSNIDYVDSDSKPEVDRNTDSSKSISRLETSAGRGGNDKSGEGASAGDVGMEELEEEVEQTIQTPPKVTDKNGDEAKKTINLFKKRPDYTKLYSKYTKSTASPTYMKPSTTTTTTTIKTTTAAASSTAAAPTPLYYDSEEEKDKQPVTSFGSRLSQRDPVVSVRTSTSTRTIKSYPYSPKPTAGGRSRGSFGESERSEREKSEAAPDEPHEQWTRTAATAATSSTTSSPSLKFSSLNRFRTRFSSTTTWRPTTGQSHSTSRTSSTTVTPTPDSSTPTLFVGKLGNLQDLQDLGMFDVDDPEQEEAIDVPVISKQAPDEVSTGSPASDHPNPFKKIYSSNAAGALNARLTGQRVTKNTAGQKSAGYRSSFSGQVPASQFSPEIS